MSPTELQRSLSVIELPILKTHQNIGDFYVGAIKAHDLYHIAEADRLRLESLKIPKYAGYQRVLSPDRVASIKDYLVTPRSTFPNAIILSLDSEFIDGWSENNGDSSVSILKIKKEKGAVQIIDGQHRVEALESAPDDFQVIVTLFIDLKLARCAEIFAKINSTQKTVNPSIAFQLFGYLEERSPRRTAHEIAEALNTTEGSPFYRLLKMLGTKDAWTAGTLSQSTFCKELMSLYTRNFEEDENRLLRQEQLDDYNGYPLRTWFIEGNDRKILETVWKFFLHAAETWPSQWRDETGRSVLTKTTGYTAFVRVLKHWLLSDRAEQVLQDRGVREALASVKERYNSPELKFIRENYESGNQGVIKLRDQLLEDLHLSS